MRNVIRDPKTHEITHVYFDTFNSQSRFFTRKDYDILMYLDRIKILVVHTLQ